MEWSRAKVNKVCMPIQMVASEEIRRITDVKKEINENR